MKKKLLRLFKKETICNVMFHGSDHHVNAYCRDFIDNFEKIDREIICVSLCQDFQSYENREKFILIAVYKEWK